MRNGKLKKTKKFSCKICNKFHLYFSFVVKNNLHPHGSMCVLWPLNTSLGILNGKNHKRKGT